MTVNAAFVMVNPNQSVENIQPHHAIKIHSKQLIHWKVENIYLAFGGEYQWVVFEIPSNVFDVFFSKEFLRDLTAEYTVIVG
jgi:hypothetical protein